LFADDSPQVNEITDMEDIGGKNKNQKLNGFAVSHKRKRTSVENNEQSQC
jgi:hypothetical protein